MESLDKVFQTLAAHIDAEGSESYRGLTKMAKDLGMTVHDRSGGFDVQASYRLARDKRKLWLDYVLIPGMNEGDPPEQNITLRLRGGGKPTLCRRWRFVGDEPAEPRPVAA